MRDPCERFCLEHKKASGFFFCGISPFVKTPRSCEKSCSISVNFFSPLLTELNLNVNNIGDDSAKAIAEALKVNPVLTKLDLRWNNMGDAGKKAVRDAVKDRSGFLLEL